MKLYECPECFGAGECDYVHRHPSGDPQREVVHREICRVCNGEKEITFEEWQAWETEYPIPYYLYDEQATAGEPVSDN